MLVLHERSERRDRVVQLAGRVVEILRHPVHLGEVLVGGDAVDGLNERAPGTRAASRPIDVEIFEVDAIVDEPGRSLMLVVDESEYFAAGVDRADAVRILRRVEETPPLTSVTSGASVVS